MSALAYDVWYPRDAYIKAVASLDGSGSAVATLTLDIRRRAPTEIQSFTYTASGTYGDDTYVEFAGNRIAAAEAYPNPLVTRIVWEMPWLTVANVMFRFRRSGPFLGRGSRIIGTPVPPTPVSGPTPPTTTPDLTPPAAPPVPTLPILPALPTLSWPQIRPFAKIGEWVRRTAWPASRKLTYIAGAGTTRAVAIISDSTGLRVVQAADFRRDEFLAFDWVRVPTGSTPPAFDPARPPTTPLAPNDSAAPGNAFPQSGQWIQVADEGTLRWVQIAPFACPT